MFTRPNYNQMVEEKYRQFHMVNRNFVSNKADNVTLLQSQEHPELT
jgi:hypothetical protein